MSADEYLKTPEWSEFTTETVCGRRVQVWRRRLTQVTELLDVAATAPDLDLVVQADRRISSADFLRTVRTGAAQLAEADIGPADRVLIVLHNSPEFLLSMWSTWGAGAVPVLGNRWWSERELDEVTRRLEPTLVITDMSLPSDLAGTVRVLAPDAVQSWWDLPAADPVLATGGDEDDVALILFTAGSTGVPKGVQQSHRVILATQQTLHVMRGGRPPAPSSQVEQGVTLLTTPLFHNGGIVSTISALLDGNRTVLTKGRFDPAEVVELIERERVMS